MDPMTLVSNAAAIPLTVGLVKMLDKWIALSNLGKVVAGFLVAAVSASAVELMGKGFGWPYVPLVVLGAWLAAMGAWNGGKTIGKAVKKTAPLIAILAGVWLATSAFTPWIAAQGGTENAAGGAAGIHLSHAGIGGAWGTEGDLAGFLYAFPLVPPDSTGMKRAYVRLQVDRHGKVTPFVGDFLVRVSGFNLALEAGNEIGGNPEGRAWVVLPMR